MKSLYLGLLFSVLCAFLAPQAHAGSWKLARYEYTLKSHSITEYYQHQNGQIKRIDDVRGTDTKGQITDPQSNPDGGIGFQGGVALYCKEIGAYPADGFIPGRTYLTLTVTPIFVWQRGIILTDPGEPDGGGTPDPNDNPPSKMWYREYAQVYLHRADFDDSHNTANPYDGHHFTIGGSDGLDTSISPPVTYPQEYMDVNGGEEGSNIISIDTHGGETVPGTTRTLKANAETTGDATTDNIRSDMARLATINVYYRADYVTFNIGGRLKAGHEETNLNSDWSGFSTIAAGHLQTSDNIHQGDVLVTAKWGTYPNFYPVSNMDASLLPNIVLNNKEGVEKAATIQYKSGKTDANGYILGAVVTSSDMVGVPFPSDNVATVLPDIPGAQAQFNTTWGSPQWKLLSSDPNADTELDWDPHIFPNQSQGVVCKPRLSNNVPLTGHKMRFYVSRVWVTEADPNTGLPIDRVYVIDDIHSQDNQGGQVMWQDPRSLDQGANSARFAFFGSGKSGFDTVTDSNNGIYIANLHINSSLDWQVKQVEVAVEDQGVYEKVNQ